MCVFGLICNVAVGCNCTRVHSPFSLMRWGVRAVETLPSWLMFDVPRLPLPNPIWSASVCAHSADTDVSFLTQRSIFFKKNKIKCKKKIESRFWLTKVCLGHSLHFCLILWDGKTSVCIHGSQANQHIPANNNLCFNSFLHRTRLSPPLLLLRAAVEELRLERVRE